MREAQQTPRIQGAFGLCFFSFFLRKREIAVFFYNSLTGKKQNSILPTVFLGGNV
jgi:hypothetical protein